VTVSSPVPLSNWTCHGPEATTTVAPPQANDAVPFAGLALSRLCSAFEAPCAAVTAGACGPLLRSPATSGAGESARTAKESAATANSAVVVEVLIISCPARRP
jgi:hypothetical protein